MQFRTPGGTHVPGHVVGEEEGAADGADILHRREPVHGIVRAPEGTAVPVHTVRQIPCVVVIISEHLSTNFFTQRHRGTEIFKTGGLNAKFRKAQPCRVR